MSVWHPVCAQVLRGKTASLENVDEQRKFIEGLPNKIMELIQDIEVAQVSRGGAQWVSRHIIGHSCHNSSAEVSHRVGHCRAVPRSA